MAESSPLQSSDDRDLLQAALQRPFEPADVPLSSSSTSPPAPAPAPPSDPPPSEPEDADAWQATYAARLTEWRAQSAAARSKAELARAEWETVRAHEDADHRAHTLSESSDGLGDHITVAVAAADEAVSRSLSHSLAGSVASLGSVEHVEHEHAGAHVPEGPERAPQGKAEGSPSQRWEHLSSSPSSSYPSMSFPEASVPQSPSQQHAALAPSSARPSDPHHTTDHNPSNIPLSTLPSIMDNRIAPRTRLSLVLSSLAINLVLPFINGVMLGFGEIFAKDVIVGWFGWKRHGSTAAGLGLRR